MKIASVIRRVCLPVVAVMAMAVTVVGCGGGNLNVNNIGPNKFASSYVISGDTPIPGEPTVPVANIGTVNVILSRIDLADDGTATGTVSSSTLNKFQLTGTIDKEGNIVLNDINIGGKVKASYTGKLTIAPNGTRTISGTLTFTNGQSTPLDLKAGPAAPPPVIPPPTNDNFVNARTISGSTGSILGTTAGDTGEPGEPNHACRSRAGNGADDPLNSVWYKWTAPADGTFRFFSTREADNESDPTGAIYTADTTPARVDALNFAFTKASDDIAPGNPDFCVTLNNAVAGDVYYIAVASFSGRSGTFTLNWEPGACAAGIQRNSCSAANN